MDAVVEPPAPVSVELTLLVVLILSPVVVPVTLTEIVQLPLAAIVPPLSETLPEPATAVADPAQVLANPLGVATTSPAGRVSVNATPVRPIPLFGFVIVKVSDVVAFTGIEATPNALVIDGGEATVIVAVAVLPVPPFVDVTLPVVFVNCPDVVPVTVTLNTH